MSVPALRPGDRAPNLTFPDLKGRTRQLYLEVSGGLILVAVAPNPNQGEGKKLLSALARRRGDLDRAGAHRFALMRREAEGSIDDGAVVMIDPYGDGMKLFRPLPDGSEDEADRPAAAAAVLDANQRVLAVFTTATSRDPIDDAMKVLMAEAKAVGQGPAHRIVRSAPVLMLENVLSADLCEALIALWREENSEGKVNDGLRNEVDATQRRTRERVVADPEMQREIAQQIGPRLINEVQKAFNYSAPLRFETLTVVGFDAKRGDFVAPHRNGLRAERRRRFAISINLNGGYAGGELAFAEYGTHLYAPARGAAAVYGAELLQEDRPVTEGERFVLTSFLTDPK